jgi:hypothetical protein
VSFVDFIKNFSSDLGINDVVLHLVELQNVGIKNKPL